MSRGDILAELLHRWEEGVRKVEAQGFEEDDFLDGVFSALSGCAHELRQVLTQGGRDESDS